MTAGKKTTRHVFADHDLSAQVECAQSLARDIVRGAFSESVHQDSDHVVAHVRTLTGHDGVRLPDEDYWMYEESLHAAFALGIAVGQLVSPQVFTGDARLRK